MVGAVPHSDFHFMKHPVATIGRYDLFDEFASGGQASVHLGRVVGPAGFIRAVAIKRVRADRSTDESARKMMMDEATLASRVQHPNVVQTVDVVWHEGELVLVMELVQGESLGRLIQGCANQGGVPVPMTVAIIAGALRGLHAAHEALDAEGHALHLVHRDLSPQNIIVDVHGVPKVLDFGVAKARRRSQDETHDGIVKGKPAYMAPEQVYGETDRRSDLWAMGVVLWEALANARLFNGNSDREVLGKVLGTPIPSLRGLGRPVSEELEAVVQKALNRDVEQRFQTAAAMAAALDVLAPATAHEVSRWVVETAGPAIEHTRQQVRELESVTGASVPMVEAIEFDETGSIATKASRPPSTPNQPLAPRRWVPGLIVAVALMLGVGVGAMVVFLRPVSPARDVGPARDVAIARDSAPLDEPAPSGVASVGTDAGLAITDAGGPEVALSTATGGGTASDPRDAGAVQQVTARVVKGCVGPRCKKPERRPDCSVPYTLVKGVKQWRKECF